jgi:hypothetical protein
VQRGRRAQDQVDAAAHLTPQLGDHLTCRGAQRRGTAPRP